MAWRIFHSKLAGRREILNYDISWYHGGFHVYSILAWSSIDPTAYLGLIEYTIP